jgi:hypothetical protein
LNILKVLYWFAGLLLLAEALVQLLGFVDVRIYQGNNQIGYIPAPNQSGAFMRSHTWRFNEYSMGRVHLNQTLKDLTYYWLVIA